MYREFQMTSFNTIRTKELRVSYKIVRKIIVKARVHFNKKICHFKNTMMKIRIQLFPRKNLMIKKNLQIKN